MTAAHVEHVRMLMALAYPEHDPREHDPHYHFFNAARRRMKEKGLLVCAIKTPIHSPGPIELHHDKVEYSLQNGIDLDKFNELYGLHLDDEGFKQFIEEEGNLEPLCALHHRGAIGVHSMLAPQWNAYRVWKDGLAAPSTLEKAK